MDEQLIQEAAQTFCIVPEIYQQAFKQAGADFPDELVQQIKAKPDEAVKMLQSDKGLLDGVMQIYSKYKKEIDQAAAQASQQKGLFKKGGKLDYLVNKFATGGPTRRFQDLKYISQTYDPTTGEVFVEMVPQREMLIVNQEKDPNSDFNTAMGEYDNPQAFHITANRNGILSVGQGYNNPPYSGMVTGADSAAVVNRAFELAQKAPIKLAFPKKNANGKK